jgi:hypothetical protein
MVLFTQVMQCELIFQTVNALAFSSEWQLRPKGPWSAVGFVTPSLFVRDFTIGHIAWGVISVFAIFVSHRLSVLLRFIRLMEFVKLKLKLKLIYYRQSVGQSVLVPESHLGPMTRFLLSVWRLQVCWYGAPSLTRGWVCNFLVQLLPGLARALTLGSKSRRTHGYILLSHLRLAQPGGPGSRIYIPQEQGGPVIPPGTGFPFCRLLRLTGLRWRYSNMPPWNWVEFFLTADDQSTSSSWYRAPLWGPWPDFILILSLVTIALLFFL